MPQSQVVQLADPAEFRAAVRAADGELLVKGRGEFRSEVIRVDLHQLWMQRISDKLPRIIQATHHSGRAAILFLTHSAQAPVRHSGVEVAPGEIIALHDGASFHHCSEAPCRVAAMSLTLADFAAASKAIIGHELAPATETRVIRPDATAMARLMALHDKASKLAMDGAAELTYPASAMALEQDLVRAMVACLAEPGAATKVARGHAKVVARFEEFVEYRRYEPVYLAEICAAIGVSERTLRTCCQEHLGMGPIHYLWLRRMHLAHRALLGADADSTTVTQVATEHGFWELGRFSVEYRSLFGEPPSASLHRSQH